MSPVYVFCLLFWTSVLFLIVCVPNLFEVEGPRKRNHADKRLLMAMVHQVFTKLHRTYRNCNKGGLLLVYVVRVSSCIKCELLMFRPNSHLNLRRFYRQHSQEIADAPLKAWIGWERWRLQVELDSPPWSFVSVNAEY